MRKTESTCRGSARILALTETTQPSVCTDARPKAATNLTGFGCAGRMWYGKEERFDEIRATGRQALQRGRVSGEYRAHKTAHGMIGCLLIIMMLYWYKF